MKLPHRRQFLHLLSPEEGDTTKYFLDHPKRGLKIEVYVLRDYLREKYGLEFRTRTGDETV
jgi:hypothetical protein